MSAPLPFDGLRVVALEQAVAAPFCSRQFSDLGADVIKIERPGEGDPSRSYDGVLNGVSAYFAWLNRGKRSMVLDLKQSRDLEVCSRMLDGADVFLHNLAPGAVERMGFGYAQLSERHPRLIWCGISGYGPDGPYRDKKAYDMLIQAESGVVGITGSEDAPAKVGVSVADIAAGHYAYSSILAALFNRHTTGLGERIDISMLECLAEWMMPPMYVWLGSGRAPARAGVRHNMIVPYGAYACADGSVMFAIQNDREWRRFCEAAMADASLAAHPRFGTNPLRLEHREELEGLIERRFAGYSRAEVLGWLDQAGIATGSVNDVPTVAAHPQLKARERWRITQTPSGDIPALIPPHNLAGAAPRMGRVPGLGEHTDEILRELELGNTGDGAEVGEN
ncbi:MAG: CaiB/BaiF CoA-transferase family protein [Bryobacteraceae bacterium]